MERSLFGIPISLLLLGGLTSCSSVGSKSASLTIIYIITAVLALLLLFGYLLFEKKKDAWLVWLFSCVSVVNVGYFLLSVSKNLEWALMANRISYLGSVFLPLAMLVIILRTTGTRYTKWLTGTLFLLGVAVFVIAASPGVLDIYYKEVTFEIIGGSGTLIKVYGPLHPIYLFYLVGYFSAMVVIILRAMMKKKMDTTLHAILLAGAVFVNIGVWFIEQIVDIEFEMLSISYIISELFLLGISYIVNENRRLKALIAENQSNEVYAVDETLEDVGAGAYEVYTAGIKELTQTEKLIYDEYIARATTKEIMEKLNIKENTLKFHNKNIYSKLGVSSRKELIEIYKQISANH